MKAVFLTCQLQFEHKLSGEKRQTNAHFMDDAVKTRSIKSSNVKTRLLLAPRAKTSGYAPVSTYVDNDGATTLLAPTN